MRHPRPFKGVPDRCPARLRVVAHCPHVVEGRRQTVKVYPLGGMSTETLADLWAISLRALELADRLADVGGAPADRLAACDAFSHWFDQSASAQCNLIPASTLRPNRHSGEVAAEFVSQTQKARTLRRGKEGVLHYQFIPEGPEGNGQVRNKRENNNAAALAWEHRYTPSN